MFASLSSGEGLFRYRLAPSGKELLFQKSICRGKNPCACIVMGMSAYREYSSNDKLFHYSHHNGISSLDAHGARSAPSICRSWDSPRCRRGTRIALTPARGAQRFLIDPNEASVGPRLRASHAGNSAVDVVRDSLDRRRRDASAGGLRNVPGAVRQRQPAPPAGVMLMSARRAASRQLTAP